MTKKAITFSLFTMLGIALISSCAQPTTTPSNNTNNTSTTPQMSAKINNKLWVADNITTSENYNNMGLKAIIGIYSVDNSQLTVFLPSSATKKKYSFDGKSAIVAYQTDTASFSPYPSNPGSGNINVTRYSGGIMQGTFSGFVPSTSGSASSLINITEGTFTGEIQ